MCDQSAPQVVSTIFGREGGGGGERKKLHFVQYGYFTASDRMVWRKEESLDHDVRQQMERISMVGGDRNSLMPLMELAVDVTRAIHVIH